MREIDLVAEVFASFGGSTKRVQCRGYHRTRGLLVVEDSEGGGDEDADEDGCCFEPAETGSLDLCKTSFSCNWLDRRSEATWKLSVCSSL